MTLSVGSVKEEALLVSEPGGTHITGQCGSYGTLGGAGVLLGKGPGSRCAS